MVFSYYSLRLKKDLKLVFFFIIGGKSNMDLNFTLLESLFDPLEMKKVKNYKHFNSKFKKSRFFFPVYYNDIN